MRFGLVTGIGARSVLTNSKTIKHILLTTSLLLTALSFCFAADTKSGSGIHKVLASKLVAVSESGTSVKKYEMESESGQKWPDYRPTR